MFIDFKIHEKLTEEELLQFSPTIEYITKFLTADHPARSGNVCPFVKKALTLQSLYFGIVNETETTDLVLCTQVAISKQRKDNLEQNKVGAVVLLVRPSVSFEVLQQVHRKLMLETIEAGMMLGVLGPQADSPSFHHTNFFPFRAPQNILVVREMIAHDLVFILASKLKNKSSMIRILEAYIKKMQVIDGKLESEAILTAHKELNLIKSRRTWFWRN